MFATSLMLICIAMLSTQIEMVRINLFDFLFEILSFLLHFFFQSHNNSVALFIPMFNLSLTLVILFLACELAGKLGGEFEIFNDMINRFSWYLFPLRMQKMLPLIMMNSQPIIGFYCFGSIMCNRETFRKVRRYSFTH